MNGNVSNGWIVPKANELFKTTSNKYLYLGKGSVYSLQADVAVDSMLNRDEHNIIQCSNIVYPECYIKIPDNTSIIRDNGCIKICVDECKLEKAKVKKRARRIYEYFGPTAHYEIYRNNKLSQILIIDTTFNRDSKFILKLLRNIYGF